MSWVIFTNILLRDELSTIWIECCIHYCYTLLGLLFSFFFVCFFLIVVSFPFPFLSLFLPFLYVYLHKKFSLSFSI